MIIRPLVIFLMIGSFCILPSAEAVDLEDLRIYGYFDLEYDQSNNNQGNVNGSFDSHHFNLLMDFPVTSKLIVKSHIEYEHGVDTSKDSGKVKIEWSFFEYHFRDEFKLRGGIFFSPFGLFNEIRDSTPAFLAVAVPNSIYFAKRRGGFDFLPEQNTGLNLLGQIDLFQNSGRPWEVDYDLFVGNGENTVTTNSAESDDNGNKAFGGRIMVRPNNFVTFGGSFFVGNKAITKSKGRYHHSMIGSLMLDNGPFNVTLEAGYSKFRDMTQLAGFAQTSYDFGIYTPFYRYEYLDPNTNSRGHSWQTHLVGLNSRFIPGLYLKTEIQFHDRGKNNSMVTHGKTTFQEYRAAVIIAF